MLELIRRTSVDLPADVERALRRAYGVEAPGSRARAVLATIVENVKLARKQNAPLCQDTGALLFRIQAPAGGDTRAWSAAIRGAVFQATRRGYLRQNTVDVLTGRAYPDNVAAGAPSLEIAAAARETSVVRLMLKGGGSENMGRQYSLPDERLGADRDLEGVRRCLLDAVFQAQGNGCAPGFLGVCIGGDRSGGHVHAKEQLFRALGDAAPVAALADLERRLLREANALGIGPMGLGGKTTLLGVKIGALSRLPASFFVTVSYMCWALRRRGVSLAPDGSISRWLD